MGYTLERGESSEYIYSVDYRSLKEDEKEEYFEFFSSSGWLPIASQGDIHLFRADPGTNPIYSDRDTTVEKYENLNHSMKSLAIPLVVVTVLIWIGAMISSGTLKSFLHVIAVILSVVAFPTAWTVIATYNNKWKAKEKKGLVNLFKITPYFLLFIAVIILFVTEGSDSAISLLAYMVIGAVAFPTAIWVILSLYHKMGGSLVGSHVS